MKKLLLTGAIAIALLSCGNGKYNVSGSFEDNSLDGKTAYLINYDTKDTIDSVTIKQNLFSFSGEIDAPTVSRLIVNGVQGTRAMFILDDGDIVIDTKNKIASGTELNDLFATFCKTEKGFDEKFRKVESEHNAGSITQEDFINKNKALTVELNNLYKETYNNNNKNPIGYYAFLSYTYEFTSAQFDSIMADAPESLANMKRVKTWIDGAKKKERTAEGKKFVDFVITSEDGLQTSLSDFVGKGEYTLVDFWASWCGPCIRESEVIKEIYNEYNGKGLNVLGVAVWDEPENTRNSIKKHELPWQQIINAQTIPTDLYGITGIPHIIIFAPDGTIVSRGLYGDDLKAKVKELMTSSKK